MPPTELQTTLLTFESWVTKWDWYHYALAHPEHVPYLLIDRALCEEPFLDAFADSPAVRQPVISGVCRERKNFTAGASFMYRTKIDPRVAELLGLNKRQTLYFAVAALGVVNVVESHELASRCFSPRRYVVAPKVTPYPPNLVHAEEPVAAACRESCIVFRTGTSDISAITPGQRRPLTPLDSLEQDRINTYAGYQERMRRRNLRVALCRVEAVDGHEALCLDLGCAPIISSAEYEVECGNGRIISAERAAALRCRIAASGMPVATSEPCL
jgi:hypothetical protein